MKSLGCGPAWPFYKKIKPEHHKATYPDWFFASLYRLHKWLILKISNINIYLFIVGIITWFRPKPKNLGRILCSAQLAVCSVQCEVCSMQCAVYNVDIFYTVQCAVLHTVSNIQCVPPNSFTFRQGFFSSRDQIH